MPTFRYLARQGPHQSSEGVMEAESRLEVLEKLSQKGLYPLKIEEYREEQSIRSLFRQSVSKKDLLFLTRQLSDLLESNVPLLAALDLLREQAENPALRRLIQTIMDQVRGGQSFSEALGSFPHVFSRLYVSLVFAGEIGGMLAETMNRLALFMEQEEEFQSRLLAALTYPAFVILVGGLTIIFLMLYVVPRLAVMFIDTGQGMPLMARVLSHVSHVMNSVQGLLSVAVPAAVFAGIVIRFPNQTKAFTSRALFKIPVWGMVLKKGMLARFTKTLAMLLIGGVPIIRALQVVSEVLDHPSFHDQIRTVTQEVEQGRTFAESLRRANLFPVFVCQMIAIGEESNTIEKSLEKVSTAYERETDRAMKLATALLEPVMILGVGSVIGVIVIGMLLPIFEMSTLVK